jgi:hypothetical protein
MAMNAYKEAVGSESEKQIVVPTTHARQGVTGHNVRYVLIAGTIAVVVLFCIVYAAYFS